MNVPIIEHEKLFNNPIFHRSLPHLVGYKKAKKLQDRIRDITTYFYVPDSNEIPLYLLSFNSDHLLKNVLLTIVNNINVINAEFSDKEIDDNSKKRLDELYSMKREVEEDIDKELSK